MAQWERGHGFLIRSPGLFDLDDRLLAELLGQGGRSGSACRRWLISRCSARRSKPPFRAPIDPKGGRPAFDHVLMFKALILQAMHARAARTSGTEFLIGDRLSFMRFLGLGLADGVPDAATRSGRSAKRKKKADATLMACFGALTRRAPVGRLPGDERPTRRRATVMADAQTAQHDQEEKKAIKEGHHIPADWKDKPAKLAQKDRDARAGRSNTPRREAAQEMGVCAGGRPRDPGVRLQEPCLDRSGLRPDPQLDDDARRRARAGRGSKTFWTRTNTARRRLGGYGLPVGGRTKRMLARRGLVSRTSIARSRQAGRCLSACVSPTRRNPKSAARPSTCSRIQKGPMGLIVRTTIRHGPRQGENRHGQSGLQHYAGSSG